MSRGIDYLGRIVIPKEMRKKLNIKTDDKLNIELIDNQIIITKDNNDYEKMNKTIKMIEDCLYNSKGMDFQKINEMKQIMESYYE